MKVVKRTYNPRQKVKVHKFNPMTINQHAGRTPNDVEIRIGDLWIAASSIAVTWNGALFWKSEFFLGNSPESTWRWKL